jgi:peptide/nickel transport system ATP-binding protein
VKPAVVVERLQVTTGDGNRCLIDDVSFTLAAGEVLGIVGESGSGKTTLGLALLGHCRRGLVLEAGRLAVGGREVPPTEARLRAEWRGRQVCYVPQDPASALNPALRIGTQIAECLPAERRNRETVLALLAAVKLPVDEPFLNRFAHQLSGGQLQRVAIAMAFANRPPLIVMDEPTTGLDVTTQAHVLETVRHLCAEFGVAALYVTHDIAVVAAIAQRVAVVYAGRIVELGPTARVLYRSAHPYTRALIRTVPDIDGGAAVVGIAGHAPEHGATAGRCSFAPRCPLTAAACLTRVPDLLDIAPEHSVRCWRSAEVAPPTVPVKSIAIHCQPEALLAVRNLQASYGRRQVLRGVSFDVAAGECVGVVGESGSGKTTLARCLAGLQDQASGLLKFRNDALALTVRRRDPTLRRHIQYIFQNPYASFNPSRTIGASLGVALEQASTLGRRERQHKIDAVLAQVSLPNAVAARYPRELSGGQRQRAAIARALIADPALLICDEITSALDVSVQAVITELLCRLQRDAKLALLFVTHNLAVVRGITQRVIVMQGGVVVETGPTEDVMRRPQSAETQRLLRDAPRFSANKAQGYDEIQDQSGNVGRD